MEYYLQHHGIKGQKWGIRRYQNPDGTLTEEGKKRYLNSDGSLNNRGLKQESKFMKSVDSNWWKSYNKATDTMAPEIEKINSRYSDVTFDDNYSSKAGQRYIKEMQDAWRKIYSEQLLEDFGPSILLGNRWVDSAPLMDMLDEFALES